MKNKALLLYGYALKNAGDMAITEGAIDLLLLKGYSIKLIMRYNKSNWEYKESVAYLQDRYKNEDIEFEEGPFTLDRNKSFGNQLSDYLDGVLKVAGLKKEKKFEELIKWADVIFFNGGNLIRCKNIIDYARLRAYFSFVPLAIKSGKPYCILPNSCSTINWFGRKYIGYIIKHAQWVFAREKESHSHLKKVFPEHGDKIILSTDLAYFINTEKDKKVTLAVLDKTVVFTLRAHGIGDIKQLNGEDKDKIWNGIESAIKYLLSKKYKVTIVTQTLKDKEISNEIYRKFQDYDNVNMLFELNPDKLRSFYSNIDLLIGMRLHSIILATSVNTPAIGFFLKEWGLKNPGLMRSLELPFFDVEEWKINESTIDELLQNRSIYSELINKNTEKLKTQLSSRIGHQEVSI